MGGGEEGGEANLSGPGDVGRVEDPESYVVGRARREGVSGPVTQLSASSSTVNA